MNMDPIFLSPTNGTRVNLFDDQDLSDLEFEAEVAEQDSQQHQYRPEMHQDPSFGTPHYREKSTFNSPNTSGFSSMLSTPHSHAVIFRSDVEDRAHSTPNSRFDLRSILQGILQKILSNQETIQKTQSREIKEA